ncbi:MAG: radical SAM protein [Candidatus Krumholzibacteriota bacterium]|nr:radical SAM protein [Candidatus Krumholzibacteriota bacterium]
MTDSGLVFGPVPSRRLGQSLGINNIPAKVCTYACVYCQVGRTRRMPLAREAFFDPEALAAEAAARVDAARRAGERIDALTLVADGEPTLDRNLGRLVDALRGLAIPVAVISNASLIGLPDVREELARSDWVSLKVDAVDEAAWRRVNRPHPRLALAAIQDGIRAFARDYRGTLVTETLLVAGVNDGEEHLARVAAFLAEVAPATAYLAVPVRPPTERGVRAPSAAAVNRAYQALADRLPAVELLTGYEGNAFAASGDLRADLLGICAVHPMREDAVAELMARDGAGPADLRALVDSGELAEVTHEGRRFYLRRPPRGT